MLLTSSVSVSANITNDYYNLKCFPNETNDGVTYSLLLINHECYTSAIIVRKHWLAANFNSHVQNQCMSQNSTTIKNLQASLGKTNHY